MHNQTQPSNIVELDLFEVDAISGGTPTPQAAAAKVARTVFRRIGYVAAIEYAAKAAFNAGEWLGSQ